MESKNETNNVRSNQQSNLRFFDFLKVSFYSKKLLLIH